MLNILPTAQNESGQVFVAVEIPIQSFLSCFHLKVSKVEHFLKIKTISITMNPIRGDNCQSNFSVDLVPLWKSWFSRVFLISKRQTLKTLFRQKTVLFLNRLLKSTENWLMLGLSAGINFQIYL